jgi:hypothetical protein
VNILAEALGLPPIEKAALAENLLSGFECRFRKTIDALWAQEVEDRIDAFERKKMTAIPAKIFVRRDRKKTGSDELADELFF